MQTKTILEQTQQETKKMYKDAECQCQLIDAAGDSSAKKGKNNDKEKNKERKNVKGSKNHKKNTSNMI